MNWFLYFLLFLGLSDIALIRLTVVSMLEGEAEIGLFATLYIQNGILAVMVSRLFQREKKPWYHLVSRICQVSLAGLLLLTMVHLISGRDPAGLILPDLYEPGEWTQAAILPLRWTFSLAGLVLMLGRKESRKKFLIRGLLFHLAGFMGIGFLSAAKIDETWKNLIANACIMMLPHAAGFLGALFETIWKKKIPEEKSGAAQQKTAAQTVKPGPAAIPEPKPEAELQELQKKYKEKQKRHKEAGKQAAIPEENRDRTALKTEKTKDEPTEPVENPERPLSGTEMDDKALGRFIQQILAGSENRQQAEPALQELISILKKQQCPQNQLEIIRKALDGLRDDWPTMQTESRKKPFSIRELEGAAVRAREARRRREEQERYGRC